MKGGSETASIKGPEMIFERRKDIEMGKFINKSLVSASIEGCRYLQLFRQKNHQNIKEQRTKSQKQEQITNKALLTEAILMIQDFSILLFGKDWKTLKY